MNFSARVRRLKPSATLAINAKAQELKAQGRKIISLAVGEPDFPTPAHIREAGKKAIDDNFTRYTPVPGVPELRAAVAGYFKEFYLEEAPAKECVIVSNGGKQVLYNLFQCLLDPGDEVLIPGPYWVSYPDMVELADGVPVVVPTTVESGFKLTVADLDKALTPRTRLLILNSPSNPTGGHYTQAQMEAIAEWARAKNVFVVADEIYDRLVYDPATPASLAPVWQKFPETVAVVNGLAKAFSMTGWRVGYALAHPDLVKAMVKIQGQSTSNICSIAQKAAIAALTGPKDDLTVMRAAFHRRRDLAMEIVAGWKKAVCPTPEGAFYLFPRLDGYYTGAVSDSKSLCAKLLDDAEVALVPGAEFGEDACVRFSYAVDDKTLTDALERVGKVLKSLE